MLVCHKDQTNVPFEGGKVFNRGDVVDDPKLEAQIREHRVLFQYFTAYQGEPTVAAPTTSGPATAPKVAAGPVATPTPAS